jgi:hypothetical protein
LTEHILRAVDIVAELEVVDLAFVILVKVFSNDEVEDLVGGGENAKILKHSLELLGGNMARLGSIEVLEARLEEHSVRNNDSSHLCEGIYHHLHFLLGEGLNKYWIRNNKVYEGMIIV